MEADECPLEVQSQWELGEQRTFTLTLAEFEVRFQLTGDHYQLTTLSLSPPPFTAEGAYGLKTTIYQLFLRMRAEVSLFGRQGPKYFIWPIRIRAGKNEPI